MEGAMIARAPGRSPGSRAQTQPGGGPLMPDLTRRQPRVCRTDLFDDPGAPAPTSLAVKAFVVARNAAGQVLLVRRIDSGEWELPGGGVIPGESALGAARREAVEEAGVVVEIPGLVGLFTSPRHVIVGVDGAAPPQ